MTVGNHISSKETTFDTIHILGEHAHTGTDVYPTLAAGVDVLSGIAWTLGAFVEIIPVNTITRDFDIHWLVVENVTDDEIYECVLYAATTEITRVRFGAQPGVGSVITFNPIPIQMGIQTKNTQIQAKLASSGATETATVSVMYHIY